MCSSSGPCVVSGLKTAHLFLSPLFGRCLIIERMNRPGRAQRFTGCGFILGLRVLAVLLSPLTKALDLLEDLRISREIHQHALLCFVPGQLSITTKADSRKFELQEKVVTSLPSMPRRPKPGLELYLWDFTRQLLQARCKTLWVEEQS